ncbi:DUF397 domain-containing protein [Streptomyces sp. Je 1-369]|uniref:DUF397 domain-containing protein n=1 Tax=Streptomyces sp. Je 1-369 TaxID=2966192 RepID=UPI0022856194|nr:DUF397 domain-containing protein [Streptomyces sp. Je 1-369]WAL96026.1 DUF397 domain-containing protein [Streptomyces sp. Je 1-369]
MLTRQLSGVTWLKSSYSGGGSGGGDCIEVANLPYRTAVRDSKNPVGSALTFGGAAWRRFVDEVKGSHPG